MTQKHLIHIDNTGEDYLCTEDENLLRGMEVLGRRATDSTEQAREQQAMNVLRNRKYDEELQTWLRQIRDEAYVENKLPAAEQTGTDQAAQ